jgi:hypothetical protein
MSEIHAAFAHGSPVTLSRLDELVELLQNKIPDPDTVGRALDLLKAMASPEFSASLHDRDAAARAAAEKPSREDAIVV